MARRCAKVGFMLRAAVTAIVLAALLVAIAAGGAWWELHRPGPPLRASVIVTIEAGDPFRTTAAKLGSAGVVRFPFLLHWFARWSGEDRRAQAGDFRFTESVSPVGLLEMLHTPTLSLSRVTFPEGTTVQQMAEILAEEGFGGADEFVCAAGDPKFLRELAVPSTGLEGYLFPDTYSFARNAAPRDILRTMVKRFRERFAAATVEQVTSPLSELELVTLASIIERETGAAAERALISGVFHNRLRAGMRLQSDPTAIYGWKDGPVTAADLRVESPYNTYMIAGLPPGPICNPGIDALKAAANPETTPYLYFVARDDGTHVFSKTLDEHNRAVHAQRAR